MIHSIFQLPGEAQGYRKVSSCFFFNLFLGSAYNTKLCELLVGGYEKSNIMFMILDLRFMKIIKKSGQFITTFSAGWSPQMVVKSKGPIPHKKMALN